MLMYGYQHSIMMLDTILMMLDTILMWKRMSILMGVQHHDVCRSSGEWWWTSTKSMMMYGSNMMDDGDLSVVLDMWIDTAAHLIEHMLGNLDHLMYLVVVVWCC